MLLRDLLSALPAYDLQGSAETEISGISEDSRQVKPGWLFACLRGLHCDGHDYLPRAAAAGAAAVLTDRDVPAGALARIQVADPRRALGLLAAAFQGHPSRRLRLYGVTGTNGKTTTAAMIEWILSRCGQPCGLIGTVQNRLGRLTRPARCTTPGPVELQELLAAMVRAGLQACAAEISSHALAQDRTAGAHFAGAVLTNVTRDHFDYHREFNAYLAAKASLFASLPAASLAVLNVDDPSSRQIRALCACPVVSYSLHGRADLTGHIVSSRAESQTMSLEMAGETAQLELPLPSPANAANALAALALAAAAGPGLTAATAALASFPGVPGRFERINAGQPFTVLVDYAHNPDALRQLLSAVRPHTRGRLIVVFGCEGDKDRGKRPQMGEIAAALADHALITCDNLHQEEAWPIFSQIRAGFIARRPGRKPAYRLLYSRREAIARALHMAEAGDAVVIAGKGHETQLILGGQALPFDDREVVRELLAEMGYAGNNVEAEVE